MKSSAAKHSGWKRTRHCGLIASGRSEANRDFSCVRNMNCCFARCAATTEAVCVISTVLSWTSRPFLWNLHEVLIDLNLLDALRVRTTGVLVGPSHSAPHAEGADGHHRGSAHLHGRHWPAAAAYCVVEHTRAHQLRRVALRVEQHDAHARTEHAHERAEGGREKRAAQDHGPVRQLAAVVAGNEY